MMKVIFRCVGGCEIVLRDKKEIFEFRMSPRVECKHNYPMKEVKK